MIANCCWNYFPRSSDRSMTSWNCSLLIFGIWACQLLCYMRNEILLGGNSSSMTEVLDVDRVNPRAMKTSENDLAIELPINQSSLIIQVLELLSYVVDFSWIERLEIRIWRGLRFNSSTDVSLPQVYSVAGNGCCHKVESDWYLKHDLIHVDISYYSEYSSEE